MENPNAPQPPFSHQSQLNERGRRTPRFIRCLISTILLSFVLLSAASFVAWYAHHPRLPPFTLNSLSISNPSITRSQWNATYHLNFTVTNPNPNIKLCFHRIDLRLLYLHKYSLSHTSVPPFQLRKKNEPGVAAAAAADYLETDGMCLATGKTADEVGRFWKRGLRSFNVRISVSIRYISGNWPTKHESVEVHCTNLQVEGKKGMWILKDGGNPCHLQLS